MTSHVLRWAASCALAFALGACSHPSSETTAVRPPAATTVAPAPATPAPVAATRPRDVFVMLSGGANPSSNNYSQYLQAKAVATFFERNYPLDSVWTFFGAGNVEGQPPFFGDVMKNTRRDGLMLSSWLPGALSRNRPAKRDVILRALREEILPAVRDGHTLYLFVGDHGVQATTGERESIINLWTITRDPASERGWKSDRTEQLGVAELRQVLAEGLGRGRVVFCMTQCHSGGFHHLAVPRELVPNQAWFMWLPVGAEPKPVAATAFVRAAGFTATDEFNLAAGCDPDPDPDRWAGYERFVPEHLLGLDLFTLQPAGTRRASFYEAHVEATLVDRTIDKPYTTSEQYLERWASLIETRLAKEEGLTPAVQRQVQAYQRAVDGAAPTAQDAAFRERQALFARFTQRLAEQNPAAKDLLLTGTRQQLDEAIAAGGRGGARPAPTPAPPAANAAPTTPPAPTTPRPAGPAAAQTPAPGRGGRGGVVASPAVLKLWNESIRPAWKAAVLADKVAALPAAARAFEKHLLAQEAKGKDFLHADARALPTEVYWQSGYADPRTVDPAKAEAVVRWGAERRGKMVAWALACDVPAVRTAAVKLLELQPNLARTARVGASGGVTPAPNAPRPNVSVRPLSRKTAAERVLFYRRTLAAWAFLLALDERPALERIAELTALERTPLPPPVKG